MNFKKNIPNFIKNFYTNIYYFIFTIKSKKIHILNEEETVEKIIKEKKSVARFGDGEFKWIMNIEQHSFQKNSDKLSKRLLEVLNKNDENLLLCVPRGINNISEYTKNSKMFWKTFVRRHGKKIIHMLNKNYTYGDTNFTRWYLEYEDKKNAIKRLENNKKIWNDREIVIIEGEKTRMGVGNDLFENTKSIKRILVPSTDAFEIYDKILNEAKKIEKNKLILLAIGPTATILAGDLSKEGYQAIDIGHIDIEYEWYLKNASEKIPIAGKYVNESKIHDDNLQLHDSKYEKSIICKLGESKNED